VTPPNGHHRTRAVDESSCSTPSSSSPPLSAGYDSSAELSAIAQNAVPIIVENGRKLSEDVNGNTKFPFKARSNLSQNFLAASQEELGAATKPPASPFLRKMAETGSKNRLQSLAYLSPDNERRRYLRSPNMMRLQSSMNNLSVTENSENSGGDSRSTTPKPFHCRTTQYRSFNIKHNTERQQKVLEQLAQLRANLKDKQAKMERTLSNQNLARSATTGSMAQTLSATKQ
jgi:hypothetical protein